VSIAANRDEQRSRAVALPPEIVQLAGRRVVMPRDPQGGGTWIAANDAGLAMVLLNVNPAIKAPAGSVSRGQIIPRLCGSDTLDRALARFNELPHDAFSPFRLIVTDGLQLAELTWSVGVLSSRVEEVGCVRRMWTSSGLGDHRVDGPRRELFRQIGETQDAFHRHRWPDRPHLSVCMRRADAMTVSCTFVRLQRDSVTMSYIPGPPDVTEASSHITLPMRQTAAA